MSTLFDPCLLSTPRPLLHRAVAGHATRRVWQHAAGRVAHVAHVAAPVMQTPCRVGARLAVAGLLALGPQLDAPRDVPHALPHRPAVAQRLHRGVPPAGAGFGGGVVYRAGSTVFYAPPAPVEPPSRPEDVWQRYYAGPGEVSVAQVQKPAAMPEPPAPACLIVAVAALPLLHGLRRASCGTAPAGA
jgi:hypothetical protein